MYHQEQGAACLNRKTKRPASVDPLELIEALFDTCHEQTLSLDAKRCLRLTCKRLKTAIDNSAQSLRLAIPLDDAQAQIFASSNFLNLRELRIAAVDADFDLSGVANYAWNRMSTVQVNNLTTKHGSSLENMLVNAQWPSLEELVLTGAANSEFDFAPSSVAAMAAGFPHLRRLTLCRLGLPASTLASIAAAFPCLEVLNISHNKCTGLLSALAAVKMPSLHSLTIAGVPIDEDDALNASKASWLSQLSVFDAYDDEDLEPLEITALGFYEMLSAWKHGPLKTLRVGPLRRSDALLQIRCANLPQLQSLTLVTGFSLGSDAGTALSRAHLPALEELFLYTDTCQILEWCDIKQWHDLGGLEDPGVLPKLKALHLMGLQLTPTAVELLGRALVPRLASAGLVCCGLGIAEVSALLNGVSATGKALDSAGAANLEELYLPGNCLDIWSIAALASGARHFPALECLDLGAAGTVKGVGTALMAASAAGAWPSLRQLRCTFMHSHDAAELIKADKWSLQLLDVSPAVHESVGQQLQGAFPSAHIQWGI